MFDGLARQDLPTTLSMSSGRARIFVRAVMAVGLGLVAADSAPFLASPAPELNPPPSAAASYSGHPSAWREVLVGRASLRAKTPRRVRVCVCARCACRWVLLGARVACKGARGMGWLQVEVQGLNCAPPVLRPPAARRRDGPPSRQRHLRKTPEGRQRQLLPLTQNLRWTRALPRARCQR